jgi:hypothetical protein
VTGVCHHAQLLSVKIESCELFCLCWLQAMILPISTSWVVKITAVCHEAPTEIFFFWGEGVEIRPYTLSHSTSPFSVIFFSRYSLTNYLPGPALNCDPPDLSPE